MENFTINGVDDLERAIESVRAAQRRFAGFAQEDVDRIFQAAARAAAEAAGPLAELAAKETGMGVAPDKIIKNKYAAEYVYEAYKDAKTCGVIEEDEELGLIRLAEPVGVIAAVIPATNPTSTVIFKTLLALKTRNGVIISPHPRAKESSARAAKTVLDAAEAAGAPEGLIECIGAPSLEMSRMVMRDCDMILATGGPGMVKSAYQSGKPAIGVGSGNVPAVIAESADTELAARYITLSKTFDNGLICASEQAVIAVSPVYDALRAEFLKQGAYFMSDDEKERARRVLFVNGALNAAIVGQQPSKIAALAGFAAPEGAKLLIGEVSDCDFNEEFAHEKLSPVLAMYRAGDFDEALSIAEKLIDLGGQGHTASIFIDREKERGNFMKFINRVNTCRVVVNTPSSHGAIGGLYNSLPPSLTLGCGTWGGNSVSENVGAKHLLNIKTVAFRRDGGERFWEKQ
jgi:acetaldehyde dehydrogenase/alcohol dehydrogenase